MTVTRIHGFIAIGAMSMSACTAHAAESVFTNQTTASGVIATHSPLYFDSFLAGGTVGDFNHDGWMDIYFPAGGQVADKLFINNQDGTFTDRAAEWGIDAQHRGTAAAVGDYNGDGLLDIYVTSLGPVALDQPGYHRLYHNNGDDSFTDVAEEAGVNFSSTSSADGYGAAWGDYDLDGDLDLAVAGWSTAASSDVLYRNEGDGTFTDVTSSAQLIGVSAVRGFAPRFADMDGDRYPELIWIGDFGSSMYFVNDGDSTFTNFTDRSGTSQDGTEMGVTVADFNEDGLFDFYVTTISTNNLYINQGDHVYQNLAAQAGVVNTGWGWGTVAIDFNHDTYFDLVATTQSNRQYAFENNTTSGPAQLNFDEVALQIGITTTVSGRGLSNFDYDNDGDQDLVFFPRSGPVQLYRNDVSGDDANWLRVFLDRGSATDIPPQGVGSVVKITIGERTIMNRIDGGSNYLSQSEPSAHFGLGSNDIVDELIVEWSSGDVTTMTNVAANQTLTISPDDDATPGDLDGDGDVDFTDLLALLDAWGPCNACPEDIDASGSVGFADLLLVLDNWS